MAVPKKRTSMSKKLIRRNIWKKKRIFSHSKGFFFSEIDFYRAFKKFFLQQTNNKVLE